MPTLTFVATDGTRQTVEAKVGQTLLEVAWAHGVDIEGSCEGTLACSTCHVIVAPEWYRKLPKATSDEEDMLDLAAGLTRTSRLACQLKVEESWDGLVVRLPDETRDASI